MDHLPSLVLDDLSAAERRQLAYLWADRAVREHVPAALEGAGFYGLARHLQRSPEVASRGSARRAAWRCLTMSTWLSAGNLGRLVLGRGDGRATARALYTLLDAGQAALVAAAVQRSGDVALVGARVLGAAATAPWRREPAPSARGSRAWAAGPLASVEAAAEDEERRQPEDLRFAHRLNERSAEGDASPVAAPVYARPNLPVRPPSHVKR